MNMLHLVTADDRDKLLPLVTRFHSYSGFDTTDEMRNAALDILFSGEVHAAAWLIGPRRAPVGYVAVSFGFSIELGGRDAFIDEFFIRESVRGRGMGSQALAALLPRLQDFGVKAVHLEASPANTQALRLYQRAGFAVRESYHLMTRAL